MSLFGVLLDCVGPLSTGEEETWIIAQCKSHFIRAHNIPSIFPYILHCPWESRVHVMLY